MAKVKDDQYWFDTAVESFFENVWLRGLQKFAGDSGDESATLEYGEMSIKVAPDTVPEFSILTLKYGKTVLVLSLNLEEEKVLYQVISCPSLTKATDMIEEILDAWKESFFKLKID